MTKEHSVRTSIAECELNNVEALQGEVERLRAEIRALDQANRVALEEIRLLHRQPCHCKFCHSSEPGALPDWECLVRDKAPSAYHNVKCPRFIEGKL